MKVKYNGYYVNLNVMKLIKAPMDVKALFFSEQFKYLKERFHNYFIGYVTVTTQDIYCCPEDLNEKGINKLYEVYITAGRHGEGQMFSAIDKLICQQLVDEFEFSKQKSFTFRLDLGCGISQSYTFTRKQRDMLIEQLKPILEMDWFVKDEE